MSNIYNIKPTIHFYYCATIAACMARQYGEINSPFSSHVFMMRWLSNAEKKRLFDRNVSREITWLISQGRERGPSVGLEALVFNIYKASILLKHRHEATAEAVT